MPFPREVVASALEPCGAGVRAGLARVAIVCGAGQQRPGGGPRSAPGSALGQGLAPILLVDVGWRRLAAAAGQAGSSCARARVLSRCAGWKGALPTVAAGLLPQPVIGVLPVSVGLGVGRAGRRPLNGICWASLLSGLSVVNSHGYQGPAMSAVRSYRGVRADRAGRSSSVLSTSLRFGCRSLRATADRSPRPHDQDGRLRAGFRRCDGLTAGGCGAGDQPGCGMKSLVHRHAAVTADPAGVGAATFEVTSLRKLLLRFGHRGRLKGGLRAHERTGPSPLALDQRLGLTHQG